MSEGGFQSGDKMKIFCIVTSTVALAVMPPAAFAHDWTGSSVGFDASGAGLVHSNVSGLIVPGQATGFSYTTPSPNRSIDVDRSSNPQAGMAVSYSRFWDRGSAVWGLEGEIGYGGSHDFEVGPYEAGFIRANGPGTVGSISKQLDTVGATLDLNAGLTIKASVGVKIGERALLSVFAGPTVVQANVKTTQSWNYDTVYASLLPGDTHFQYRYDNFTESVSGSRSETLVGGVIGVEGRYRLNERMTLRAQASVRRYTSFDMAIDAGGGETRLSVEPQLVFGSIGLLYSF